jgi:membrane carboxypeptidase/penicillin-binding protein PbpC
MTRSQETWDELRRLVAGTKSRPKDFWEEIFGSEDALFYDAEGNDRTDLFRALIERIDQTTRIAEGLAERVAVLERLAVQDEARIALEIEKLRKES